MVPPVSAWLLVSDSGFDTASEHVFAVLRDFASFFVSRGVVQLSAYVDQILASYSVPARPRRCSTPARSTRCQSACSACPYRPRNCRRCRAKRGSTTHGASRLDAGLRHFAYFVVPSAVAFIALGDVIASALFQTGRFTRQDAVLRVGHRGGVIGRPAGLDTRPAVFVDVLRVARHLDAAAVCRDPCSVDGGAGPDRRLQAAALAGNRTAMGHCRSYRLGRRGWLD